MVHAGDVHTIDQWMTLPYIAHTYHVPESYLYNQLRLSSSHRLPHTTLQVLAISDHQPVSHFINQVQQAILAYRNAHPTTATHIPMLLLAQEDLSERSMP